MFRFLFPGFALLLLIGCNSSPEAPAAPDASPKPAPPKEEPAKAPETPAQLKHDGFVYGGFEKTGMQTYVVKISGQPEAEGTQSVSVKGLEDGTMTFERMRGGALAPVGSDVVKIDSKGVTVVSVSIGKLVSPSLELPADLSIGKSWQASSNIETDSGKIQNSGTYKVVGDAPIKVQAGSFSARKVQFTGTIETSQGRGKLSGTYWFVKGLGAVKTEMTQAIAGQQPQTFVLELKK